MSMESTRRERPAAFRCAVTCLSDGRDATSDACRSMGCFRYDKSVSETLKGALFALAALPGLLVPCRQTAYFPRCVRTSQ